uniref:N-terminal EF-hand calcium binding protein 3 n=1 Tax=Oryctolagus cuniculus TaxID=9986 RepID=A0A5F9DT44_RABIT
MHLCATQLRLLSEDSDSQRLAYVTCQDLRSIVDPAEQMVMVIKAPPETQLQAVDSAEVFRRADKNDDGKLSFEEFQNYFADGVLSAGELRELFSGIDGRPAANVETEKLCDYFSEHLGVYRPVLAALESLNRAVLTAMDTTKLEYEQASKVDQFVTRFLLRETASQLQALQSSLEGASDTLEAQARDLRSDEESAEVQSRPRGSRRAGRRALRIVPRSPTWSPGCSDTGRSSEAESQWRLQVSRLQELIDQLECKAPRLEPLQEEDLAKGPGPHILVAQRQVQVAEEALKDFHRALCCYMDFTGAQSRCLQHQQAPCSKAFQRILIDHLRAPDTLTTVSFPGVLQPQCPPQPGAPEGSGPEMADAHLLSCSLLVGHE